MKQCSSVVPWCALYQYNSTVYYTLYTQAVLGSRCLVVDGFSVFLRSVDRLSFEIYGHKNP